MNTLSNFKTRKILNDLCDKVWDAPTVIEKKDILLEMTNYISGHNKSTALFKINRYDNSGQLDLLATYISISAFE